MKLLEKRVLALCALREYPGEHGDRIPPWIGDLAYGPQPHFHDYDRLMHGGYITWNNGWHLTGTGWQALNAAKPKERR